MKNVEKSFGSQVYNSHFYKDTGFLVLWIFIKISYRFYGESSAGRKLRCDRKDEPLLAWLLGHPNISNRFVQADDQYSYIEFEWMGERQEGKS